jgi:hypothetical protein
LEEHLKPIDYRVALKNFRLGLTSGSKWYKKAVLSYDYNQLRVIDLNGKGNYNQQIKILAAIAPNRQFSTFDVLKKKFTRIFNINRPKH